MPELLATRAFTSSQTYTPTSGTASIVVKAVGGGGGSGGAIAATTSLVSFGCGGGAGALAVGRMTSSFSGLAITIGSGGAAGASTGGPGGTGGDTSLGSAIIAGGGAGGQPTQDVAPYLGFGGQGGVASGTHILFTPAGMKGGSGNCTLSSLVSGGRGGDTIFGKGGRQEEQGTFVGGAATTGEGYGAGGGGPCNNLGSAINKVGKAGAPGIMVIWEWST